MRTGPPGPPRTARTARTAPDRPDRPGGALARVLALAAGVRAWLWGCSVSAAPGSGAGRLGWVPGPQWPALPRLAAGRGRSPQSVARVLAAGVPPPRQTA